MNNCYLATKDIWNKKWTWRLKTFISWWLTGPIIKYLFHRDNYIYSLDSIISGTIWPPMKLSQIKTSAFSSRRNFTSAKLALYRQSPVSHRYCALFAPLFSHKQSPEFKYWYSGYFSINLQWPQSSVALVASTT